MKRRSTILTTASAMLAAVVLGTSCQKEAAIPTETRKTPVQNAAMASLANREAENKYEITDTKGESVGLLVLYNNEGYADLQLTVKSSLGPASDLFAGIFDKSGEKLVRLANFNVESTKPQPFENGDESKIHTSLTFPVINLQTGERMYAKEFMSGGLKIAVYDKLGTLVANGAIE